MKFESSNKARVSNETEPIDFFGLTFAAAVFSEHEIYSKSHSAKTQTIQNIRNCEYITNFNWNEK